MSFIETVLDIDCAGERLRGIVSAPAEGRPVSSTGVVIIVGGPQYRAGSHRQFVLLSRALADGGFSVLRFDCRGMGDSDGTKRDFSDTKADIKSAIDSLQRQNVEVKSVTLWGLCDGASAALLYLHDTSDVRVTGVCLVNPWIRSEATMARAQIKHYYTARLKQPEFWMKLLSGKVAIKALGELAGQLRLALASRRAPAAHRLSFQQHMAEAWRKFPGHILLLLSEKDLVAKEFVDYTRSNSEWALALDHPRLQIHDLANADHTCSNAASRALVESLTLAWQQHAADDCRSAKQTRGDLRCA